MPQHLLLVLLLPLVLALKSIATVSSFAVVVVVAVITPDGHIRRLQVHSRKPAFSHVLCYGLHKHQTRLLVVE